MNKFVSVLTLWIFCGGLFAMELNDVPDETLKLLKKNTEITIEIMQEKGFEEFGLDEKSLQILSSMIDKEGATYSEKMKNVLPEIFGSYLGELIIKSYGGKWGYFGNNLAVSTTSGMVSFPLQKVYKHIVNGEEDSIFAFYIFAGQDPNSISTNESSKNQQMEQ